MTDQPLPIATSVLLLLAQPRPSRAKAEPITALLLQHQAGRLLHPAHTLLTLHTLLPSTPTSRHLSDPQIGFQDRGFPLPLDFWAGPTNTPASLACVWDLIPFRFTVGMSDPHFAAVLSPHPTFQPTSILPTQASARALLPPLAKDFMLTSCSVDQLDLTGLMALIPQLKGQEPVAASLATLYAPLPSTKAITKTAPQPA